MANFVSYSDMTTIMTAIGNKFAALNGAYVIKGNVAFANLPATLTDKEGFVYNVTDEFTTDTRFVEGSGKKYPAGTNVVVVNIGDATTPNLKFDVIGNFIDVDAIYAAIGATDNSIADGFDPDKTGGYAVGDIVMKDGTLYQFTSAHTEGDPWDDSEVAEVTLEELIDNAEPESLTPQQISDLTDLL